MFLVSEQQRQRTDFFDIWVEQADIALANPAVMRQLGALGTELINANDEAFLPNIRHDVVSVPRRHAQSNGPAILPLLEGDGNVLADETLFEPTPRSFERTVQYFIDGDYKQARKVAQAVIDRTMQPSRADVASREYMTGRYILESEDLPASTMHFNFLDEGNDFYYACRSLVAIHTTQLRLRQQTGFYGGFAAHELTHVVDNETRLRRMDPTYGLPFAELRAYAVQDVVDRAAEQRGRLSPEETDLLLTCTSTNINRLRRAHRIDRDTLLNGDFQLQTAPEVADLIADMQRLNAF